MGNSAVTPPQDLGNGVPEASVASVRAGAAEARSRARRLIDELNRLVEGNKLAREEARLAHLRAQQLVVRSKFRRAMLSAQEQWVRLPAPQPGRTAASQPDRTAASQPDRTAASQPDRNTAPQSDRITA